MPGGANRTRDWWAQPKIVLPIVGAVAILLALLTPQRSTGRIGDSRLSAHLAGLLGARALAETAARLGFDVTRRDSVGAPALSASRGHTIHAVLAPTVRLTSAEAHAYLEAVREGDGLLLVFDGRNALSDSLGVWRTPGGILYRAPGDSVACRRRDLRPTLWPDGKVHLYGLRWLRGAPTGHVVLAAVQSDSAVPSYAGAAAAGFALGRGRVVVIADPDLLRNDVLRRCEWGADVLAVGMLEWLRAGGATPRRALVFDEYHQGFGPQPSVLGTAARFLVDHSVGRGVLGLMVAGLVWLAAVAPRPIPPREARVPERRDPLEQVDALAHAYQQVGATRTMVARLLHGVRARVHPGSAVARLQSDDAFLADALIRHPSIQNDVALIRSALREPIPARDLPDVGGALHRLELSLTTSDA